MSKRVVIVPTSRIAKMSIVFGNGRSLSEIQSTLKCPFVMNAGFYHGSSPVGHLKSDGIVYASETWKSWGYAWDAGSDISLLLIPDAKQKTYITGVDLITPSTNWGAEKPTYLSEVGGKRQRTALALTKSSIILYCSAGADIATPERLRDELKQRGAISAIMLDGGGSTQCSFEGVGKITSARRVNNYLCVWLDEYPRPIGTFVVDTGGSTLNIRATPSTNGRKLGYYRDGTKVEVYEVKKEWARTFDGWCCTRYLKER